jgi:hypothetical protein
MPQQPAQLSEVNQVLNAKVQKRTMKLAQVNHALQAEIRVRQRSKAARVAIEEAPSCQSAKFFLLIRLTHRESETRFFYEKTWFVLEDSVKNPVSLVCVRPGLTDQVISGEELLIDKLNLMCSVGN